MSTRRDLPPSADRLFGVLGGRLRMHDDTPLEIQGMLDDECHISPSAASSTSQRRRCPANASVSSNDAGSPVPLDLPRFQFIESAGAHALAELLAESRADHWRFEIEPRMSQPGQALLQAALRAPQPGLELVERLIPAEGDAGDRRRGFAWDIA
jgi:hypothetical protein